MARIVAFSQHRVKPNRKSPRPDRPFASGLLGHSEIDEKWYYARLRAQEQAEPTDEEIDAMAEQSQWQYRYEQGLTGPERCYLCQAAVASGELTAGLCSTCIEAMDRDGDLGGDGGRCAACSRIVDYLEDSGMCLPCDLRMADMSASGNKGY